MIHPDGSGIHVVPGVIAADNLDWSPDGSKLVYDAIGVDGRPDIYVSDADGTHRRNLTRSPGKEAMPAWSPDGSQILYGLFRLVGGVIRNHADLYIMNTDGSQQMPLVRGAPGKYAPDWQPTP
jgi:TolB protein